MSRRIRHHVNPLKLEHVATGAERLALPADGPVEVELGCADARWLFERAAARPELFLVGIEIRAELVRLVERRARALGLAGRLRVAYANLSTDLEALFAPRSVDRFAINFPDPWFKRRHHKRRLLSPELSRGLASRLRPGGEVLFQSDVWELALEAMEALEQVDALENACGPWSFSGDHGLGARSKREARCLAEARPIWRLLYRLRDRRPR